MEATQREGDGQRAFWNGAAGRAWVEAQEITDRLFQPFEDYLVKAVAAEGAARVMDLGCGTGQTTVAAARVAKRCTGIDISEPMIAAARERAEREGVAADFLVANADEPGFAPGEFDLMISRFGVMFFEDPVGAFGRLRGAVRDGGGMVAIAWRGAEENPFMTAAERAVGPLLPGMPPRRADGPGQFAFADDGRVRGILEASGWVAVEVGKLDLVCAMPEGDLLPYVKRLGPVGRALGEVQDEGERERILDAVRGAFAPYVREGEVRFNAACWVVRGRR